MVLIQVENQLEFVDEAKKDNEWVQLLPTSGSLFCRKPWNLPDSKVIKAKRHDTLKKSFMCGCQVICTNEMNDFKSP